MEKFQFNLLKNYQSFSSVEEMDEAVKRFLYVHKTSLSEGNLKVLRFIWRHSVKIVGVSFAKYGTIAEETNLSRRTVIRTMNKLEEMGIIKRIPTARANGKQGVNLIVIQPFSPEAMSPHDVTPAVTPDKAENKQNLLCNDKNKSITGKREELGKAEKVKEWPPLDESFLPDDVHPRFVKAASPFFYGEDIYELWQRVKIAYEKSGLDEPLEFALDQVVQAFKETVLMKKTGRIHTTFEGYFYKAVYEAMRAERRKKYKSHSMFCVFEEMVEGV